MSMSMFKMSTIWIYIHIVFFFCWNFIYNIFIYIYNVLNGNTLNAREIIVKLVYLFIYPSRTQILVLYLAIFAIINYFGDLRQ